MLAALVSPNQRAEKSAKKIFPLDTLKLYTLPFKKWITNFWSFFLLLSCLFIFFQFFFKIFYISYFSFPVLSSSKLRTSRLSVVQHNLVFVPRVTTLFWLITFPVHLFHCGCVIQVMTRNISNVTNGMHARIHTKEGLARNRNQRTSLENETSLNRFRP